MFIVQCQSRTPAGPTKITTAIPPLSVFLCPDTIENVAITCRPTGMNWHEHPGCNSGSKPFQGQDLRRCTCPDTQSQQKTLRFARPLDGYICAWYRPRRALIDAGGRSKPFNRGHPSTTRSRDLSRLISSLKMKPKAARPCPHRNTSFVPLTEQHFGLARRLARCKFVKDRGGLIR